MKQKHIIRVSAKCSDLFSALLLSTEEGKKQEFVGQYDGYVPDWMPGEHWGDYVILDIDVDTGVIVNWKKPTKAQLNKTFGGDKKKS
jgi:hypothetical protein